MLLSSESQQGNNNIDESERFVQAALDALSAHVAILDEVGVIIGVNAAWRKFAEDNLYRDKSYGIGINYLAVCDSSARLNSNDAAFVAQGIRDVAAGRAREFQLEYPCHSPYEKRWFVVRISRFVWYGHLRLIVAHQNVSELKRIQVELAESKQRIEAIMNNVNNAILSINGEGIIQTVNTAAAKIFGYGNEALCGLALNSLLVQNLDEGLLPQEFNGEHGHELLGKRADGDIFPIYLSLNKLALGDTQLYTCIVQDITARKRIEAEIIERERIEIALEKERELRVLKNRFLSMMGHELNTPLASITLSYDMLKKYSHRSTPEENEQALDNIRQQVDYLRDMVKDVMTLSRSEAEGLSIDPSETDLITYCRDVVEEFQFTHQHSHQVEFECEERSIRAQIDRRMLRRVFTNLISNAIKYSPQGGEVIFRLRVNRDEDNAVIDVHDSGIGIPQADLSHLFEPFHRAGNVDTLPGTGLGLAIAKQIIDQHGGTITVESTVGKGTRFTVTLPLHQAP